MTLELIRVIKRSTRIRSTESKLVVRSDKKSFKLDETWPYYKFCDGLRIISLLGLYRKMESMSLFMISEEIYYTSAK
jgi:hypothetical protein